MGLLTKRLSLSVLALLAFALPAVAQQPPTGRLTPPAFIIPTPFISGTGVANGPIKATDGTAGAPSVTFAAQTGTGIYRNPTTAGMVFLANTNPFLASDPNAGTRAVVSSLGWTAASNMTASSAADIMLERDAAATLALKNSTTAQKFVLYQTTTGPVKNTLDMTAPTISSGFGTSPSIVAGGTAFSYRVNVGTGGVATSGVIGLPTATTGWNCTVQDMTNNTATRQTASTTSTATFTAAAAWAASDILVANCISY